MEVGAAAREPSAAVTAEAASRRGDWDTALACWESSLEDRSGDPEAPHWLRGKAVALAHLGRDEEAEAVYRLLVNLHPTLRTGHTGLAWVAERRRNWLEVVARLEHCLAQFPGDASEPQWRNSLGCALLRLNRDREAHDVFQRLAEQYPTTVAAHAGLARVAMWRQNWAEAIGLLSDCIERFPDNPQAPEWRNSLGWALARLGKYAEAEVVFRTLVEGDPPFVAGYSGLAWCAERQRNWPEVAARLRACLAQFPNHTHAPAWRDSLAAALVRLGRHEPAQCAASVAPDSLPEVLEYCGEFGPELVLFLPFCRWLSKAGILKAKRLRIYRGMRCFYDDLECLQILEKDELRRYVPPENRPAWLPVKNEHTFDHFRRPELHLYPELRTKFRVLPLTPEIPAFERPILIVHNKHTIEWSAGPVNHIPLSVLNDIFTMLKGRFTIIYIRHGIGVKDPGYSDDEQSHRTFLDRAVLDSHPEVLCFDDLYAAHRAAGGSQDLNTFKNVLFSRCQHFISSQGGGAHHIAFFSRSLLVILHRRGSEELWAYGPGYYGFLSADPPTRAICRTDDELVRTLPLFIDTTTVADRVVLAPGNECLLAQFPA